MKPNTYVKIVSSGIANPVEELLPFIQGEEIMPLGEDETVEVRSSVFNEGNIIIFRNRRSREVLSVIHTPHTVYIQEQNKTISTHRPFSSFLFGMDEEGKLEPCGKLISFNLPSEFYIEASQELQEVAAYVISVLSQLQPSIIEVANEFDRFNLPCRKNVGMEPAFGYLNEAIEKAIGYYLTPVKGTGNSRFEIDYFYVEPSQREFLSEATPPYEVDKIDWPIDPDTKMPVDPTSSKGRLLGDTKVLSGKPPVVDLTLNGQQGS